MTKKSKFFMIMMSVVMVSVLITSIGVTVAIWAGEGGDTGYAPQADTSDWNTWAKYFTYENAEGGVAITGYSGTNLQDVIFPSRMGGKNVVEIKNTVFKSTTQKEVPLTIKISPYVTKIASSTFANMTNLQSVVFGSTGNTADDGLIQSLSCGESLFSGCVSLKNVIVLGSKKIKFGDFSFMGCTSLTATGIPVANGNVIYTKGALAGSPLA